MEWIQLNTHLWINFALLTRIEDNEEDHCVTVFYAGDRPGQGYDYFRKEREAILARIHHLTVIPS